MGKAERRKTKGKRLKLIGAALLKNAKCNLLSWFNFYI